jgi:hypothetical protein
MARMRVALERCFAFEGRGDGFGGWQHGPVDDIRDAVAWTGPMALRVEPT